MGIRNPSYLTDKFSKFELRNRQCFVSEPRHFYGQNFFNNKCQVKRISDQNVNISVKNFHEGLHSYWRSLQNSRENIRFSNEYEVSFLNFFSGGGGGGNFFENPGKGKTKRAVL
jgi:hypothetical protein